jgi:aspartyl-tRNA synthetase
VTLTGWVARRRDHGGVIFIDLRDASGVAQVVFREGEMAERAHRLRAEFCVKVTGQVAARPEGNENPELPTGAIEVTADDLTVLSESAPLPFPLDEHTEVGEEIRLKYRYLDLRRAGPAAAIRLRSEANRIAREVLHAREFVEVETPTLTRSTPEGARDFLVPARLRPGSWYALPQSPQLFKQLLMVAGLERYYQIARCYRDEDFRADRQPEFTQLDIESSFVDQDDVIELGEEVVAALWRELAGYEIPRPIPRLTYAEAMARYGSDKPDLRFEMELQDLSASAQGTTFAPFASALEARGVVKGIVVKGGAHLSRKQLDELQEVAKRYGAGALAWVKLGDELSSSLLKALGEEGVTRLAAAAGAERGDAVLVVAGRKSVVNVSLGALRNEVARREKLIKPGVYVPLWVTEFPMFEYHEEDDRYYAMHHPFTSPVDEDLEKFERAVEGGETHLFGEIRAKAYDAVVNGIEVAGGSIRIHRRDVQRLVFKALGLTEEKARERFGFFLDALEYGTPPHGGIAAGIERTLMALTGIENIRDLMAFPKTASAADLMIDAPGSLDPHQLDELYIRIVEE